MELPEQGSYATGILFLDPNEKLRQESQRLFEDAAEALDLKVFAWRDIPKNASCLGPVAQNSEPFLVQVFVKGANFLEFFFREFNVVNNQKVQNSFVFTNFFKKIIVAIFFVNSKFSTIK